MEMAKFALGKPVADEKGRTVTIRAAFLSKEGQQHYAVEFNGAISFVEEARLANPRPPELAA